MFPFWGAFAELRTATISMYVSPSVCPHWTTRLLLYKESIVSKISPTEPICWPAAVFSLRLNLFSHRLKLFSDLLQQFFPPPAELIFSPAERTVWPTEVYNTTSNDDTGLMNWTWKEASVPRFTALPPGITWRNWGRPRVTNQDSFCASQDPKSICPGRRQKCLVSEPAYTSGQNSASTCRDIGN